MPFELLNRTSATLTSFTGRTEVHGKDRVPAVSFRLKFRGPNTLLDLLSPTARKTFYTAAEGQEDLPGVEPTTPLLRSKDIKHWSPDNGYEGWTVTVDYGIDDETDIEMGSCKIDGFACDLHDGGTVDIECRVSTSNLDWAGAGRLWSKQQCEVQVMFAAPLTPSINPDAGQADGRQMTLDGSTGTEVREPSAARQAADAAFSGTDPEPGDNWPFPRHPAEDAGPDATDTFIEQHAGAGDDAGEDQDDDVQDEAPAAAKPASRRGTTPPAKYRDPDTGQTWSGRGLKPRWLTVALEGGKQLADFEMRAH